MLRVVVARHGEPTNVFLQKTDQAARAAEERHLALCDGKKIQVPVTALFPVPAGVAWSTSPRNIAVVARESGRIQYSRDACDSIERSPGVTGYPAMRRV